MKPGTLDDADQPTAEPPSPSGPAGASTNEQGTNEQGTNERRDYEQLFTTYAARVKGYLVRRGLSPAAAEDLTQEVVLTAWTRNADDDDALDAQLFSVARDRCLGMRRRATRPQAIPSDPCWVAAESAAISTSSHSLPQLVGNLAAEQLDALRQLYLDGRTIAEAANILGVASSTVQTRALSATATIATQLHSDDNHMPAAASTARTSSPPSQPPRHIAHHHPAHHPPTEELLSYAVGASELWLDVLVACHLTYCPTCRNVVAVQDAIGGALLELYRNELEASVSKPTRRKDPTHRLGPSTPAYQRKPTRRVPDDIARNVPRPLHPFMRDPMPRFRKHLLGIEDIPLNLAAGGRPVRLLRLKPGFVIDSHGHAGLEWMLILTSKIRDERSGDTFARGDVSRRDESDVHRQIVDPNAHCIAVIAHLGPSLPKTLTGRLLARVTGL